MVLVRSYLVHRVLLETYFLGNVSKFLDLIAHNQHIAEGLTALNLRIRCRMFTMAVRSASIFHQGITAL